MAIVIAVWKGNPSPDVEESEVEPELYRRTELSRTRIIYFLGHAEKEVLLC
ncbi:MAG TPA: hypothetical protein VJZ70_07080 [Limnochordia bacterium]|jgi:hypothetical protein|nr:hypothetical protein [Bacillota bacterium]HKM43739.1 hypothetical protein [Limnochordia bacterium]